MLKFFQSARMPEGGRPAPCSLQVVEVPDQKMSESSSHSQIGSQQLNDPGCSIEGLYSASEGNLYTV